MRAAIFIDGGYVLTQFKQKNIEPDYSKLSSYVLEPLRKAVPLDLLRVYFYYCAPYMSAEPTEDELRRMDTHEVFVEELEDMDRWSVRLGKLQKRREGQRDIFEQKRVDVLMSVDLVRHAAAGHIQHAILLAGDSDFVPAVEAAKDSGVTVSLWSGPYNTVHKDLVVLADEVFQFDWRKFPKLNGSKLETGKKKAKKEAKNERRPSHPKGKRSGAQGNANNGGRNQRPRRTNRPTPIAPANESGVARFFRKLSGK